MMHFIVFCYARDLHANLHPRCWVVEKLSCIKSVHGARRGWGPLVQMIKESFITLFFFSWTQRKRKIQNRRYEILIVLCSVYVLGMTLI